MTTRRKAVFAVAAGLLCAASLAAQKLPFPTPESGAPSNYTESPVKADIAGFVRPPAGVDLPERVQVRLETHTGILLQRTWAAKSGHFQFHNIVCGFYVVATDVVGYKPVRIALEHSFIPAEGMMLKLVPAEGESSAEASEEPLNPRRYEAAREFQKGLAAFAESNFPASIKYFKKTIEIDAGLDEAYIQLAQAYWLERKPAEAQAVLQKAAILNPQNPRTLALLGRAYRVQQQWEKAVTNLHHALKLKEDLWITHFELSESFSGWGRADDAFPHARRAHELNANEPSTHQLYYNMLIHRRDYPAALAELDEFLRLFPKHALAERARQQRQALSSEIAKSARN